MKITINEPCHENWEAMTRNQQGAFCKSCLKDVVDFSKMKLEEIKSFFGKPQTGKVCGRFDEKQLSALTFDDFFAKFKYWDSAKKFAVIFFFTFGFWMFSNSSVAQETLMMKGEVAFIPDKTPVTGISKKNPKEPAVPKTIKMGKIKCTTAVSDKEPITMGDTTVRKPVPENNTTKNENMVLGMIVAQPRNVKLIEVCQPHEIPLKNIASEKTNKILPNVEEKTVNPVAIKIDSVAPASEKVILDEEQISIYPNPTSAVFYIETKIKQSVQMLDESGRTVLKQNLLGITAIDVRSLNSGVYHLILTGSAGEAVITKKIIITK